jgi:Rrf2 family protein
MLRRESQYALEGLLVLAKQPQGSVMRLKHVAQAANVPADFLARILQKLKRHNLVTSYRGAVRGYSLACPAHEIALLEIFEAVEGPAVFQRCIFSSCGAIEPRCCRLQREWAPIAARLRAVMEETSLAQVASRSSAQRSGQRARRAYA